MSANFVRVSLKIGENVLATLLTVLYFSAVALLVVYSLNCYVMVYFFSRKVKLNRTRNSKSVDASRAVCDDEMRPVVTTQIPVYNERNVISRCVGAVCDIDYPQNLHHIQILDDSDDQTRAIVDELVSKKKEQGFDIEVLRRKDRKGFKAGALENGLKTAKGELIAIFDADFMPPGSFLKEVVPRFREHARLGFVQARWGHLNESRSLLTQAQSIGIDGHFMIEQSARAWNGLFLNFNGTAGLWRKQAIVEGGGWSWDTLTEDMDLSYRAQLANWETAYLIDLVVPAEIPEDVNAFKSQQFRWAKGSIQTAIKILPRIWNEQQGWLRSIQATLHLTHYLVHPLMLISALLALPVLLTLDVRLEGLLFTSLALMLAFSVCAPNILYVMAQKAVQREKWWRRIVFLPVLVLVGTGLAINNTQAVLEALAGIKTPFVRTPKKGDEEIIKYRMHFPFLLWLELGMGAYCAWTLTVCLGRGSWPVSPFIAIYSLSFFFMGALSLRQSGILRWRRSSSCRWRRPANITFRL